MAQCHEGCSSAYRGGAGGQSFAASVYVFMRADQKQAGNQPKDKVDDDLVRGWIGHFSPLVILRRNPLRPAFARRRQTLQTPFSPTFPRQMEYD